MASKVVSILVIAASSAGSKALMSAMLRQGMNHEIPHSQPRRYLDAMSECWTSLRLCASAEQLNR
jgi:hypothetical protein